MDDCKRLYPVRSLARRAELESNHSGLGYLTSNPPEEPNHDAKGRNEELNRDVVT
ncbi:hypothetical protein RvY_15597 [Ramazzottius varieornatus]|uniref:Uncharacterized protein n=1 Tax=Ramazzottius varieornatus TaxID=947166 RepID=A0A1D1VVH4_RAMVA|nr:hypothetical protein RvY_15597 [Ramazzottius varieornatus]